MQPTSLWKPVRSIALLSGVVLGLLLSTPATVKADIYSAPDELVDDSTELFPTRRESGLYRCGCNGGGLGQVILLLPDQGIASTIREYPTFHWYTPTLGENQVRFTLQEVDIASDTWEYIYSSTMRISGEPTIHSLTLPSETDLPPLEVGKTYLWSVEFACDPDQCHRDRVASGWIQRIELDPTVRAQLEVASRSDQVTLAADNGLWLDAYDTLAQLLAENPGDESLRSRWVELLTSVSLEILIEDG